MRFQPGRLIVHRHFQRGRIGLIKLCRVVADDDRGLALWLERGTALLDRRTVSGAGIRSMTFPEWLASDTRLDALTWEGPGVLKLVPPGQAHSVWWFFGDAGEFRGWYINLEQTAARWDDGEVAGIDYVDQDLDIVVSPDRQWRWKDVEEFTERLGYPADYWVSDGSAVWAEGRRVAQLVEVGAFPFDGTWCDFRPDPTWTVPTSMPVGWDRPRAL